MLLPKLIEVQAQANYCLGVRFANGESGMLYMRLYLDFLGVYSPSRPKFAQGEHPI